MAKKPRNAKPASARKPRAKKADKGAGGDGRPLSGADNGKPDDDAMRASFASHRSSWLGWKAKLAVVEALERDVKAALKADGFTVKQFQIADLLAGSPKQEAKVRAEVADRLRVARWMGHPMGAQLDMFENPGAAPPPSVDRSYDDGKQAAMENRQPRPPDWAEPQAWMAGFHEETARRVREGIKPLAPDASGNVEQPPDDAPAAGFGPSRLPSAAQEEAGL